MKIRLIGPYPPPYGGRSVHIQRLKEQLERRGIEVIVHNAGGKVNFPNKNIVEITSIKKLILQCLFSPEGDIIHHHDSYWKLGALVGLTSLLGKKTVISIHSSVYLKDDVTQGNWFKRNLITFSLKHTSFIIADNEMIKEFILSLGVKPENIDVISAFIPPVERDEDYKKIPQCVWNFMKSHRPVISATASQMRFYKGIDVYGFDMIIELTASLKEKYPDIGIVVCCPNSKEQDYFLKISQQIKQKDLTNQILFVIESLDEVYPIWKESDIFVRPTVTDGDALSLREALYFRTTVIASDTCPRPKGVVLFKNRDLTSFVNTVKKVLDNYDQYKKESESMKVENGLDKILEVYNNLLNH